MLAFWHKRAVIPSDKSTRFHESHLDFDMQALIPLCNARTRLLEIGCGRCTLLNRLVAEVGLTAHGVDVVPEFLESALSDPRLTTEVADAAAYAPANGFDVIVLAGLINYLPNAQNRDEFYERIVEALTPGAILFIKSQFGRDHDVEVNNWSEALSENYICLYPALSTEVERLERWFDVDIYDPYPTELNPHVNTKFFHLVCRKRQI